MTVDIRRFEAALLGSPLVARAEGSHVRVADAVRQRAVFRVGADGGFEWGWVETSNGREDFREWPAFLRALLGRFGRRP